VYLDTTGTHNVQWSEIAAIVEDAYRLVAPKRLVVDLVAAKSRAPRT
jgi:hypothetical protein